MVSTQWHLNPSAQRQSSAYPSTQRQSWASPLWEVGDIFNDGPHGLGPLAGVPKGHLPHGSGYSVHIGYPSGLVLHDAAGAHHCQSRLHHCCQLQGVWEVPHKQPLAMGPSTSRPLLPRNLEVVELSMWFPASPLVTWALTLHFESVTVPLPFGTEPSFPWNSWYKVSIWDFGRSEGTAWQQWPAWRDVTLPSTQGINLVSVPFWLAPCLGSEKYWAPAEASQWGLPPLWQPSQQPPQWGSWWTLAGCSQEQLSDWFVRDSPGRATLPKMASSWKET